MTSPIAALTTIIDTATNLTDLETSLNAFLALPHTDQFSPEAAHYSVRLDIEEDGCDPVTYEPEYTERLHILIASDDGGDHGGEFRMGEDINSEMICWYGGHASSPVWDAADIAAEIVGMVAGLIEARIANHEITLEQVETLKTEAGVAGDTEMVALCGRAILGFEDGWEACAEAITEAITAALDA